MLKVTWENPQNISLSRILSSKPSLMYTNFSRPCFHYSSNLHWDVNEDTISHACFNISDLNRYSLESQTDLYSKWHSSFSQKEAEGTHRQVDGYRDGIEEPLCISFHRPFTISWPYCLNFNCVRISSSEFVYSTGFFSLIVVQGCEDLPKNKN